VTGIYLDWSMLTPKGGNNFYPQPLLPKDPANYVYGNTVYDNNAGIYAFKADLAQIYSNVVYGNGRTTTGGCEKACRTLSGWSSSARPATASPSRLRTRSTCPTTSPKTTKSRITPDNAKGFLRLSGTSSLATTWRRSNRNGTRMPLASTSHRD
jgi:parallel beta-helix repeat protein